ncbi:MAG: histidine--tRNA ligase [Polyangiales bacterium]
MAKASAQPAKGTRDFLPLDVRRRDHVTSVIRDVYERHGFEPLETPALERLDALLGKYGDEGDQLLFKILLRGQPLVDGIRDAAAHVAVPENLVQGRSGVTAPRAEPMLADLGLRYDLTVPLARVYAAHQDKLGVPFKRYQIQPVWRADTPGKGRYREFYQCDVDIVGSTSLLVEAEVAGAAAECLQRLGFSDFAIRLNHRGLLRALIEHAAIPKHSETDVVVAIDKLDKIGQDGVAHELEKHGIEPEQRSRLLALLGEHAELSHLQQSLRDHAGGSHALGELQALLSLLALTPAAQHVRFDPALARGLGYYTGCIFEVAVSDLAGSLGGGGRYDGLIGMFSGRDVPACGFSLGLERILVVMAEREMYPQALAQLDAMVAAASDDKLPAALALSVELRRAGFRVDLRPHAVKPGKLRQLADERGVRAAVWIETEHQGLASVWTRADQQSHKDLAPARIVELIGRARANEDAPP